MWHACEEEMEWNINRSGFVGDMKIGGHMEDYIKKLYEQYPYDTDQINHWSNVCRTQFPIYLDYWRKNTEQVAIEPLLREQVFDVPYKLPSGRVVRLRGKWDGVDLIDGRVWLYENKTKGDIDAEEIKRQLTFDLQTMLYIISLSEKQDSDFWNRSNKRWRDKSIGGVRYNCIRRPLSGGKGTIVRHKATKNHPEESWESYYSRLGQYMKDEPEHYFMRWMVEVTEKDITRFKTTCLDPLLEEICDWYNMVTVKRDITPGTWHYRTPFGVFGMDLPTDYNEMLVHGGMLGMRRVDSLFNELQ